MTCMECGRAVKLKARGYCGRCYDRMRGEGSLQRINVHNRGACVAPGCDRPSFARNLCAHHYEHARHPMHHLWRQLRSRAGGQYPPSWDRFEAFLADVGERPTNKHQLRRVDSSLGWSRDNVRWLAPVAPDADYGTPEWRSAYGREWHINRRFNLTGEDYAALLAAQGGGCGVCGKQETHRSANGKLKDLAIDHDHDTGSVRGLLCFNCNQGIGRFMDDPTLLRAAASYLDSFRKPRLVCDNATA